MNNQENNFSIKNIIIPVSIFIYFPFSFFIIFIVLGGCYDVFVREIYLETSKIISMITGLFFWFFITAVLVSIVFKETERDYKFIILPLVPIVSFIILYFIIFF